MKRYILFLTVCLQAFAQGSFITKIDKLERLDIERSKYSMEQLVEFQRLASSIDQKVRVVSYNILFDLYDETYEPCFRWPERINRVIKLLKEIDPDVIGIQEAYNQQLADLALRLDRKYAFYGELGLNGEYNAIFYKKSRFKKLAHQMLSLGTKELTKVELEDKLTGKKLNVFNTHLSFSNKENRLAESKALRQHLNSYTGNIVLTGDFNTFPQRHDLPRLPFLDGDYIEKIIKGDQLYDSIDSAWLGHLGPMSTFTNREDNIEPFQGTGNPGVFLDHIFVSKEIDVLIHATHPGKINGLFPSDHMPLIADIVLK